MNYTITYGGVDLVIFYRLRFRSELANRDVHFSVYDATIAEG